MFWTAVVGIIGIAAAFFAPPWTHRKIAERQEERERQTASRPIGHEVATTRMQLVALERSGFAGEMVEAFPTNATDTVLLDEVVRFNLEFVQRETPAVGHQGVQTPARLYDLRSTFASNALAAGITVNELARIMGTSVSMIEATTARCSTPRTSRSLSGWTQRWWLGERVASEIQAACKKRGRDSTEHGLRERAAATSRRACLVSLRAIAVAGLSVIATAASGCGGDSDAEAESAPVGFPTLTTTWVSPTYGYSFGHEEGRGPTPATEPWDPVIDPPVDTSSRYDDPFDLLETGWGAFFKSASTPIPEGVSIDEWVDEHVSGCDGPRSQQAEITIDGQSGRIAECPKRTEAEVNRIETTVVADGRLYLFILLSARSDYRAVFDAFASTIDLRPETASG